ncbi:protein SET [Patella vulgata]|uniref:protein SET n=1 Tax=Patella vulgata TaxID=6465 RepID=UPI00217F4A77|nr:protein SET [Patella vulgata]
MSGDSASAAKIQKLSAPEDESDKLDSSTGDFDKETQTALEDIDACQTEIDALNEKASEEILQVEQKYNKLRKPHFEARNKLIQKIPNFWMTAFINHPQISVILNKEDEECLQFLEKVEVEEFEDIKSGYNINFHFASNPYFSNDLLTKEFHLGSSGDPVSTSTEIKWKDGMDLVKKAKKNQTNGNRKRRYGVAGSFFTWFTDNTDPSIDEIAEVLKDDMWPNPLQYFLAPDIEVGENGVSDEDDDEDDEDDDDEHDESVVVVEDEDDDEEPYDVDDDEDDDDDELDESSDKVEVIEEDEEGDEEEDEAAARKLDEEAEAVDEK